MLDLASQYRRLQTEIDGAMGEVMRSAQFINGAPVDDFCNKIADYLDVKYVIPCGNGTDALRIALMALKIGSNSEVIVPSFTYIAPVEAVVSVGATPISIDVDAETFNINPLLLEKAVTPRTKAIIAVHLFGQCADMEKIINVALKYNLVIIEDNCQSFGAEYTFGDGRTLKAGAMGQIGVTSFFPTKPLGCYGDGGAMLTDNEEIAEKMYCLANHGQTKKYHHKIVGFNSRLDTLQAAVLNVKFKYFNDFTRRRNELSVRYCKALRRCSEIILPVVSPFTTHVFHQFTIRVVGGRRDALRDFLAANGIQSMIYYPMPVTDQEAYRFAVGISGNLNTTRTICEEVLSLPIDPEMTDETQDFIIETVIKFFIQ